MEALIIIGAIIVILLDYFISVKFREIAEIKGHEGRPFFWWTFFFGPIGMFMVIALPDLKARPAAGSGSTDRQLVANASTDDDLPEL